MALNNPPFCYARVTTWDTVSRIPFNIASRQSSGPAALRLLFHSNARLITGRRLTVISIAIKLEVCDRTIRRGISVPGHEYGIPNSTSPLSTLQIAGASAGKSLQRLRGRPAIVPPGVVFSSQRKSLLYGYLFTKSFIFHGSPSPLRAHLLQQPIP
jgi:hypothetical protein